MNVGDKCIGTGFKENRSMNGMIGTIIGECKDRAIDFPLSYKWEREHVAMIGYLVRWDGHPDEQVILSDCISPYIAAITTKEGAQ